MIDSTHYGRVEDAQMAICHLLCYAFMENPQWGKREPRAHDGNLQVLGRAALPRRQDSRAKHQLYPARIVKSSVIRS